jgi:GPH family glycoside/pentoside/hexuronide:cation symporter
MTQKALVDTRTVRHSLYALGNLGKSSLWSFIELFALFYLTDVLGIAASMAGLIILASLVWDALTDPIMGIVADRLRERFPTARLYFMAGAPVTALAFIAFFNADVVPEGYRGLYILIVLMLFRTAYTIVDVPHNSMLSFLSRDSRDRTNIASMRIFFSAAGKLGVTLAAIVVLNDSVPGPIEGRFAFVATCLAAVYLAVLGVCLSSIWNTRIGQAGTQAATEQQPIRMAHLMRSITSNSQLMIVFGLTAVTSLTTPIIGTAIIYFGKYGLIDEGVGANALVVMSAAQALSLLFWSKLANRMNYKKHASQAANLLLAAAMLVAVVAMDSNWVLYGVAGVAGFAIGGIFMLNWSMLPDALDRETHASTHRYNMSVFGLYTLTNKGFIGLSQAAAGWTLALFGYQANSDVAIEKIGPIISALMAFPLAGALTCALILCWHNQLQSHRR